MSIRTINYTVTADSITPSTLQRGGLQGEHNATELVFKVENSLVEKLLQASQGGTIYYRFEGHTGIGLKNSTLPVVLNIPEDYSDGFTLNYLLENWLTREGGNIAVYLIFSIISKAETLVDIYSYPARLKLEAVPDGKYTDGKNYESMAKLSVAAEDAAERAENAAEISVEAKELTEEARFALENGAEFVFQGGDAKGAADIDLVVDGEFSENSSNPISNAAVAKEFKNYISTENADKKYVNVDDYALDKKQYTKDKETADTERSDIKKKLDTISDHLIEQGINGIWYYEKYDSGFIKLYGFETRENVSITQSAGNVFRSINSFDIPSSLGVTKIHCVIPQASGATEAVWAGQSFSKDANSVYADVLCGTSITTAVQFHIEVIAFWGEEE